MTTDTIIKNYFDNVDALMEIECDMSEKIAHLLCMASNSLEIVLGGSLDNETVRNHTINTLNKDLEKYDIAVVNLRDKQ